MQLPRCGGRVRAKAVVRKHLLPGLHRPVRAVPRLAAGHKPAERGAVVCGADVPEALPVVAVVFAPAARVVEPEGDLLAPFPGRDGVHGSPREHVAHLAGDAVGQERLALRVHGDLDLLSVPVDQLRGRGRRDHEKSDERSEQRNPAHALTQAGVAPSRLTLPRDGEPLTRHVARMVPSPRAGRAEQPRGAGDRHRRRARRRHSCAALRRRERRAGVLRLGRRARRAGAARGRRHGAARRAARLRRRRRRPVGAGEPAGALRRALRAAARG